jgi:iron-sulfur cluster assembly accessory protein
MSEFPLTVTDDALEAAKAAIAADGTRDSFIRIAIQGGGCSGLQYKLDFDTVHLDDDYVFEKNGLKMVVDCFSAVYLQGTVLDYQSTLIAAGFKFVNPNAKKHCGCGSSFGV